MKEILASVVIFMGAFSVVSAPGFFAEQYKQQQVIAACLILEAGGEGSLGMQAVMAVIANRAGGDSGRFFVEATRPQQFSALNSARGWPWRDYTEAIKRAKKHPKWEQAWGLVQKATKGALPDLTGGATHYYSMSLKKAPSWAAEMDQTAKIGRHVFYKAPSHDPVVRRIRAVVAQN